MGDGAWPADVVSVWWHLPPKPDAEAHLLIQRPCIFYKLVELRLLLALLLQNRLY